MKTIINTIIVIFLFVSAGSAEAEKPVVLAPSYAWKMLQPLGLREPATIDTTLYNYFIHSVPSDASLAYATTGNLGAEGQNMIFFERQPMSDFFFRDALLNWLPPQGNHKFYNTRIPMTLVSYNTGGGRDNAQDRLKATFSGNANKRTQIGAFLDYLYSKGSYENQATKDMMWGVSGSYIGDRYQLQAYYNHYNNLNKENGGITDDLYITDPAELQGGTTTINPKSIPTNLTGAHSRLRGSELMINNRYNLGYWKVLPPVDSIPDDTIERKEFVPVTGIIWTLNYRDGKHVFDNQNAEEGKKFWENHFLSLDGTHDYTTYWSLRNTVGLSLLEGFHKYAKFGLSAFMTHEMRKYTQTPDTVTFRDNTPADLTPYPFETQINPDRKENLLWVGGQLTKQKGSLLRYEATARFGIVGPVAADVDLDGKVETNLPLFGDTVSVAGYGRFSNEAAPYLMNHYLSNHFIWENDFGKIRRARFGGSLYIPFSDTHLEAGVENVQNYIYFNEKGLPTQHGGSVQVFSASLEQNFKVGILNWRNKLTYQTSSDASVIPLPKLSLYSNLFLLFKVAGVLDVQFGVDCDYYTKYYAPAYQPATMTFHNQNQMELGNYPFMNAYVNMKLSKTRFYVLYSHVNQGLIGGRNYFSIPHYPLNPRRFQIGLSVDFSN